MGKEDVCHHTKRSITIQPDFSSGTEREEGGDSVRPDMLVYTFDHGSSRGKDRETIGINARVLRLA